jgi:hypothetical protein
MTSRFRESNTDVFGVLSQEHSDLRDMKWRKLHNEEIQNLFSSPNIIIFVIII